MPDGSKWGVPVLTIARNHAFYHKDEYGGMINKALQELTIPLFEEDEDAISDWAANDMNWADVQSVAFLVKGPNPVDFEDGWANGDKSFAD